MTKKYQNQYRVSSIRLQQWDYGWNAAYFITICTQDKCCFFGDVVNKAVRLSKSGQIADQRWKEIPEHFPFVKLGEHIIMPDHMHGIIIIDKVGRGTINRDPANRVNGDSTNHKKRGGITGNKNPMLHQNLSRIIRWYKGGATFKIRKINPHFNWQSRFYEHIIRDDRSFDRISAYIVRNPEKWIW